jgi:hypothetical protein
MDANWRQLAMRARSGRRLRDRYEIFPFCASDAP